MKFSTGLLLGMANALVTGTVLHWAWPRYGIPLGVGLAIAYAIGRSVKEE